MAKSVFPQEMMESASGALTPELIASKFSYFHEQLHLLHWQTTSYAEHQALNFYDKMVDYKDDVMEKIMGYTGKRPKAFKIDAIKDYTPGASTVVISEIIKFAADLEKYADGNNMPDICNIAQSISGDAAKVKYLLTLS